LRVRLKIERFFLIPIELSWMSSYVADIAVNF